MEETKKLIRIINWRSSDPNSGCWQIPLMSIKKWEIFEHLEAANSFLDLLEIMYKEDAEIEELDKAYMLYAEKSYHGIKSSTLSPLLFCLQPRYYCVISKAVRDGYGAITQNPINTELKAYIGFTNVMRHFSERYDFFDFSDVEGFFAHCREGKLELESYDDMMKYPSIKKLMDELSGEYDAAVEVMKEVEEIEMEDEMDDEDEYMEEKEENINVEVTDELRERVTSLMYQLLGSEDAPNPDVFKTLMSVRVDSIFENNVASNFRSSLEDHFANPENERYIFPLEVAKFVAALAGPDIGERILDINCNVGNFLMETASIIRQKLANADFQIKDNLARIKTKLYGIVKIDGVDNESIETLTYNYLSQMIIGADINGLSAETTICNLALNGLNMIPILHCDATGRKKIPELEEESFDLILGFPPEDYDLSLKYFRKYIHYLKPGGKIVIALTDDLLPTTRKGGKAKMELYEKVFVRATIDLPRWKKDDYGILGRNIVYMVKKGGKRAIKGSPIYRIVDSLDELPEILDTIRSHWQ